MNYHRFLLKNGLKVILVPIHSVESATTMVMVGAGSRYEDERTNGVSHFLEHMAFKGTEKRPTAREIANLIDGIGAESNAFTGKELTGYYIKSSANHIDLALDIISDMLRSPKLDTGEIDKERGVILEEINLYEDTPARKVGDVFENLLYGDTPMGWDIAGRKDSIKKITRADFLSYVGKLYSARNIVVVVAGKMNLEEVQKKVDQFFSPLKSFHTKSFEKLNPQEERPCVSLKQKQTEQVHFGLGVATVGLLHEKDRYPLSLLAAILGGGMSSRLFHEIREKRGLAYHVRAVSEHYQDAGYLATFAGVDPKRVDEAIQVVVEEYKKVGGGNDIEEKELEKAKEYVKGHFILELEDTKSVAAFYGSSELLERKIEIPGEVIAKMKKVRLEDVYRVAEQYLKSSRLNLALIGNFESKERFEKLLA